MVDKFEELLIANDLEKYIPILDKYDNNIDSVINLKENDLENIGILAMGDRKKLIKLFSLYREEVKKNAELQKKKNLIKNIRFVSLIILLVLTVGLSGYYFLYPYILNSNGLKSVQLGNYHVALSKYLKASSINKSFKLSSDISYAYYMIGMEFFNTLQFNDAINAFSNAYENDHDRNIFLERGISFSMIGQYNNAIQDFSRFIEIEPEDERGHFQRGKINYIIGQYTEALNDFNSLIKLNEDNAEYYYYFGKIYSVRNEYEQAIRQLSKSIELLPTNIDALIERGNNYRIQRRYLSALSDYEQAITISSQNIKVLYYKGLLHLERNEQNNARNSFEQGLNVIPEIVDDYYYIGLIYFIQEKYSTAKNYFSEAIKLDPFYTDAYFMRGKANFIEKNYKQSINDFNIIVEINQNYNQIYLNLGNAYYEDNNYNLAITNFSKAVDNNSDLTEAFFKRGISYLKVISYRKAIDDFNVLLSKNQKNFDTFYYLASAHLSLEDDDNAIINYTSAIRLKSNESDAYYYRAVANYRKDNWNRALTDLNEAIRLDRTNQKAINLRSKINSYGLAPSYRLTATQFSNEFTTNLSSAKIKYNGRNIAITGKIIEKGPGTAALGAAVIGGLLFGPLGALLGAGAMTEVNVVRIDGINCYFSDARKTEYDRLSKDQRVTIIGKCEGSSSLQNCYIYEPTTFIFNW